MAYENLILADSNCSFHKMRLPSLFISTPIATANCFGRLSTIYLLGNQQIIDWCFRMPHKQLFYIYRILFVYLKIQSMKNDKYVLKLSFTCILKNGHGFVVDKPPEASRHKSIAPWTNCNAKKKLKGLLASRSRIIVHCCVCSSQTFTYFVSTWNQLISSLVSV